MQDIQSLHICGIDPERPPRIRKEPYIDLRFKLSMKAPEAWCDAFNDALKNASFPAKVNPKDGLFIDTWVRKPQEIPALFQRLKLGVSTATQSHLKRIDDANRAQRLATPTLQDSTEQRLLDQILADLVFDTPE